MNRKRFILKYVYYYEILNIGDEEKNYKNFLERK